MKEELSNLEQKNTWDIVEAPQGISIVPTKWVFTYKFDDNGYVLRYKACLCVRGDWQHRFGDVGNTRALTLATRTSTFMMALAAAFETRQDRCCSNCNLNTRFLIRRATYTQKEARGQAEAAQIR